MQTSNPSTETMPRLKPFPALRYSIGAGDLSVLLAPPYDVIDSAMATELRARSPHNAVRLVLPEGEGDSRYEVAAGLLRQWIENGVLELDAEPGVYVYRQEYGSGGEVVARLALFGALELVPLDSGEVLPHERTHAGPKKDRLALTLATRTQLSPIFMAARDPDGELLTALADVTTSAVADASCETPDGIRHAMWRVGGRAAERLASLADRHPFLIADGHHRYETALEAARQLRESAANCMLVCVVSETDPGLVIQPTHRTLTRLPGTRDEFRDRLSEAFNVRPMGNLSPEDAAEHVVACPSDLMLIAGGAAWTLTPGRRDDEDAASGIAAVAFDRYVLGDLLQTDADSAAHEGMLEYHRDPGEAARRGEPRGAAFLLPPVSLEAVWTATAAGLRLPPKSTYFEPKMPSGLLFRSLDRSGG